MVRESLKYYRLSEGAFDITVGPLAGIWKEKIREAQNKSRGLTLPTESQIRKALSLVGSDKISLDESTFSIAFTQSGMSIDLGGYAKGYAVDKAILRLKESGVRSALVNAGGNVYCLGKKEAANGVSVCAIPASPPRLSFIWI